MDGRQEKRKKSEQRRKARKKELKIEWKRKKESFNESLKEIKSKRRKKKKRTASMNARFGLFLSLTHNLSSFFAVSPSFWCVLNERSRVKQQCVHYRTLCIVFPSLAQLYKVIRPKSCCCTALDSLFHSWAKAGRQRVNEKTSGDGYGPPLGL